VAAIAALETAWKQAREQRPGDVGAWLDVAERFLWLAYVERADRAALAVLSVRAEHPRALALLSATRYALGRFDEGAGLARRALALAKECAPVSSPPCLALVGNARAIAATGPPGLAVIELQRAMVLHPERPEAPWVLGLLLREANDFAAAAPLLERAAIQTPDPDGEAPSAASFSRTYAELLQGRPPHGRAADFSRIAVPVERRPVLPAVVGRLGNGQGRFVEGWLIVDSGAAITFVGPEAADVVRRSGIHLLHATGEQMLAQPSSLEPAVLPVLQIGTLSLTDVPVVLDADQPAPIGPGVIGTLGVSLLRDFHVVLDLQRGRFELLPPEGPLRLSPVAPSPGEALREGELSFELLHNLLFVRGHFEGSPERRFVFDTGAGSLFVDPAVLVADLGLNLADPLLPRKTVVGLGGREMTNVVVPVEVPFYLGDQSICGLSAWADPTAAVRARLIQMDFAGTFGLVVVARWGLDFQSRRIVFDIVAPQAVPSGR